VIAKRLIAAAPAIAALAIAQAHAQQPAPGARVEREIRTTGAGPQKLRIDVPLLTAGQRFATIAREGERVRASDGLGDLRLYVGSGQEVPHLLISPPPRPHRRVEGALFAVAATKTTSGFEVDLGEPQVVDALEVIGLPAPFMKRFLLEGSGDREHWTVLLADGTLFDLPDERVRQVLVRFPAGAYRYLRVTWDDRNSAPLPLPSRAIAREATAQAAPDPLRIPVEVERQASEPGRSRYRLSLPAAGLPVAALLFAVPEGDVFRTAIVRESRFRGAGAEPVELGRTRLVRMDRGRGPAAALRVPIDQPRGAELQLVIENGSNPPLALENVAAEAAELPWIYFEAPGGPVLARYGNAAAKPPQYDIEARRAAIRLDEVPEAVWDVPRPAAGGVADAGPSPAAPATGAKLDVSRFRYRRPLPEGNEGLVSLQLDAAVLAHSRGHNGGFADVRVVDAEGNQIPYLLERRDEPLSIDLPLEPAPADRHVLQQQRAGSRSAYVITMPYPNLPAPRVVIETSERVFRRPLQIAVERPPDREHRDAWLDVLASTIWQHADQGTPAEPLEISLRPGDRVQLLLIVEEGDNRPLPIAAARLLLPSWRLRFFKPGAAVSLVYGSDSVAAPKYDLALLAPAVLSATARDIAAAPEQGSPDVRLWQLSPVFFWTGLAVAALVLLALLVRLIRAGTPPPSAAP
jgi:hypothetical protein